MEREFGTKSYQPARFDFSVIFEGAANMEYQRLFARKLPGNILVSTYHTPMTIRQLAIELGVASVYLEDEIALLEQYRLLTALPGGKYQARLVIFTEEYIKEFFRAAEKSVALGGKNILRSAAKKLPGLRKLQFAGYCSVHSGYAASFADYGILPVKNRYTSHGDEIARSLETVLAGNAGALVPVVSKEQRETIKAMLGEEIGLFASLYGSLYDCALSIMRVHAPGNVGQMIGPVLIKVLLFQTVGLIGGQAVRSGALTIPEDDGPLGGFLYQIP